MTYLLVGDVYSRSPFVRKLTSLTSKAVISHLKGLFDEHGIPDKFLSDNGPQFVCHEFQEFCDKYGFEHTTSSPHFPRSNGFIERLVGTVKRIFTKCRETGSDPHLAMLTYRATPLSSKLPSPAELLSGRKYRTLLVSKPPPGDDDVREQLNKLKESSASHYNQHTRALPPLTAGQDVRVRNPTTGIWDPAQIVNATPQPRSYTVKTTNGELRRNRTDIRTTREKLTPPPDPSTNAAETTTHPVARPVVTDLHSSPPATMQLRRSTRTIKKPDRLGL